MRIYIPFRKDVAVYWPNALSSVYGSCDGSNAMYLQHYRAFERRKDAVAFMEEQNAKTKYPHKYRIVAFDSLEAK